MQETAYNAGDPSLIPGSGRSPEGENGNGQRLAWKIFLPGKFHGQRLRGLKSST